MKVNLREERINRGWTLADAAKEWGVTESAVSMIERGLRTPAPRLAFKIANEYGFTVTDQWPVEEKAA